MKLSIARLIRKRTQDLGITRGELARRMGYPNVRKGCRQIAMICAGDLFVAETMREALSRGLEVDSAEIDRSINTTFKENINIESEAYRRSFKPHAVFVTELGGPMYIPSVFSALYCTAHEARQRVIHFREGSSPETFAIQALEALPEVLFDYLGGRTNGFVVNYSPDCGACFDKEGNPKRRLSEAFRVNVMAGFDSSYRVNVK